MKKIMLHACFYLLCFPLSLSAQNEVVYLKNPSFEREDFSFLIKNDSLGWVDCGFFDEAPPSLQPGFYEVEARAQHLKAYLSLAVRDNNTWDAVGQRLVQPLQAGHCYQFSIQLAKSERFVQESRTTGNKVNFRNPIRLLIWGGSHFCEAGQLLYKTDVIKNEAWESYTFVFQPHKTIRYFTLQAYYLNPMSLSYNGNILLDNASEIVAVNCKDVIIPVQDENLVELRPRSLSELENYVSLHGNYIIFDENKDELSQYKEEKFYRATDWAQIYFSIIGKSMLYFPNHQLVIAIKGKSPRKIQRRKRFIEDFLSKRGLNPDSYQCVAFTSEATNWLTSNKDLAMRLITKSENKSLKNSE